MCNWILFITEIGKRNVTWKTFAKHPLHRAKYYRCICSNIYVHYCTLREKSKYLIVNKCMASLNIYKKLLYSPWNLRIRLYLKRRTIILLTWTRERCSRRRNYAGVRNRRTSLSTLLLSSIIPTGYNLP